MEKHTEIVATTVPPLTQSRQSDLACESGYAAKHIAGHRSAATPEQERGREIHSIIAEYIVHLVATRQRTDYDMVRGLVSLASPESAEVLNEFVESYEFDPESVVSVEARLGMDRDFTPVEPGSPEEEYGGGLDLLSMPSPTSAVITDWKSYYRVIDADTFQGKMYALLAFMHNEALQEVVFALKFPRFGDAGRSKTYLRGDVPKLKKAVERERQRQIHVHERSEAGEKLSASPGRHCYGCPLNGPRCPIADVNPHVQMSIPDRVSFGVWLEEAKKANDKALKEFTEQNGSAVWTDPNGSRWEASFRTAPSYSYPLVEAFPIINNWCEQNSDPLPEKLTISGLGSARSGALKAKKRAALVAELAAVGLKAFKSVFSIRRAAEEEEE